METQASSALSPTFLIDLSHVAVPKRTHTHTHTHTHIFSLFITEKTGGKKNERGRNHANIKGKIITSLERKKKGKG
jgi:hypothetical protein